jgi:hypothetical protein
LGTGWDDGWTLSTGLKERMHDTADGWTMNRRCIPWMNRGWIHDEDTLLNSSGMINEGTIKDEQRMHEVCAEYV